MDVTSQQRVRPAVIRTPDQRLRVFISSTLKDLSAERDSVRQAILKLRLAPVLFESGARPHPAQDLYRAYLSQSHIFIGIYWRSYGWIAPGAQVSGLEDEYNLSAGMPRLIYIRNPAPDREPPLARLLARIEDENASCFKTFATPDELRELVEDDLVLLLAEHFETARCDAPEELAQAAPTNLPIPRAALIGREQEMKTARELLLRDDVGLVTLTGTGGTGKSRLAIEIALDMRDRFQDGVYMVGLESILDPGLVVPTIAKTLGVMETAGGLSLSELLKRHMGGKQMLLLLDNFEQVMPAAPQMADLLEACPQVKLLVTSRAPLLLRSEKELPVPPLAVPPPGEVIDLLPLSQYSAVQLFVQRSQGVKPDFQVTNENAPAVAEICYRLDGLPLAIELAAARSRMLAPQALLARLDRRFEVLRGGTRDLPERQHTLYGAIDWSYNLLNEEEKRLFRCLSVFSGGWTHEAVAAVCNGGHESQPCDLGELESLLLNNLLISTAGWNGEPRLGMLETIREFAQDRLAESEDADAIRGRHASYFVDMAETAEREEYRSARRSTWRIRLHDELDNMRAAMAWALEQGQHALCLRIATSLWRFWWTNGYWREGLRSLEQGLAGADAVPDALRAKALTRRGWILHELGENPRAVGSLHEAVAIWRKIGDQAGLAVGLSNLGAIVDFLGDYDAGTAMLEEALAIRQSLADQRGACATLNNLGLAASREGQSQRAIGLFTQALALARATEADPSIGISLINLGYEYTNTGDLDRAEAWLDEAEALYQGLGDRGGLANVIYGRGRIASKRGDGERAHALLAEATAAYHDLGARHLTITGLEGIAILAKDQNASERAARLLSASDSLRSAIGLRRSPVDQASHDACLSGVRSRLDEASFAAAWAEGSKMTCEQAMAYAISGADGP